MSLKGVPPPQTIPQLYQAMMEGFSGVNKRLDGVDKRLGCVETRLDKLKEHMEGTNRRMDKHFGDVTEKIIGKSAPGISMAAKGGEA